MEPLFPTRKFCRMMSYTNPCSSLPQFSKADATALSAPYIPEYAGRSLRELSICTISFWNAAFFASIASLSSGTMLPFFPSTRAAMPSPENSTMTASPYCERMSFIACRVSSLDILSMTLLPCSSVVLNSYFTRVSFLYAPLPYDGIFVVPL